MCPEAAAEAEADKWGTIWEADDKEEQGAERPWMQPIMAAEREQLPAICPSDLRAAACAFGCSTGIGADGLHPRSLAMVSDEAANAVIQLLGLIESSGLWPQRLSHIWYFLIPKLGGGTRPIGLLPTVVRIWEN